MKRKVASKKVVKKPMGWKDRFLVQLVVLKAKLNGFWFYLRSKIYGR